MAKYKVITLAMAVKNNRIAKFGELVDDSELTLNPSALIEGGYMEKVDEEDEDEETPKAKKVKTEKATSKKDEVLDNLTKK